MSKEMNIDELKKHIRSSLNKLKSYLDELNNSAEYHLRKRSMLISYWLNDYVSFLRTEHDFTPPNRKYSRGDIVLVNFGYRVGSELGGKHFAVVLDCYNSKKSPIITVVPLSSKKENYKQGVYSFELEFGLEYLYKQKREAIFNKFKEQTIQAMEFDKAIKNSSTVNIDDYKRLDQMINSALREMMTINNLDKDMKKLKLGTIASVSQITTISKQRIINPKNNKDSLSGLKLNSSDLDTLNKYISNLYLFSKN